LQGVRGNCKPETELASARHERRVMAPARPVSSCDAAEENRRWRSRSRVLKGRLLVSAEPPRERKMTKQAAIHDVLEEAASMPVEYAQ
jgi:hypothetical protein